MQVTEIANKLQWGDKARVAKIVGCAPGTVNAVLNGWRSPETALSKRIIAACEALIEGTKRLEKELTLDFAKIEAHGN